MSIYAARITASLRLTAPVKDADAMMKINIQVPWAASPWDIGQPRTLSGPAADATTTMHDSAEQLDL